MGTPRKEGLESFNVGQMSEASMPITDLFEVSGTFVKPHGKWKIIRFRQPAVRLKWWLTFERPGGYDGIWVR
jgi:hypothetical protein